MSQCLQFVTKQLYFSHYALTKHAVLILDNESQNLFGMLIQFNTNSLKPISGQVDGASSMEKAESALIIGRVKPNAIKISIVFTAFLLYV